MPIRPKPITPRVLSAISTPVYLLRFHSPPTNEACAAGICLARAINKPTASSAAETMLEVGAFTTITPAWVAAATSTLSRPTPARATTFRFLAAAKTSASTVVADRTKIAEASLTAASRAGRSVPSTFLTSKSGPSAARVAGDSSSAINTIGLVTIYLSMTRR